MIRQKLDESLLNRKVTERRLETERQEAEQARSRLQDAEQAQGIIQAVAQGIQQQAHRRIAGIVTRCLETIFGEQAYQFKINFEQKRGKTEAQLIFERDGQAYADPTRQIGGGVVDVAAFALRLACLVLSRPPVRKVLILDEPFSKIRGEQYRRRVRDLVESLAEELGIQFVINIDLDVYPEFELGKVVRL